MVLWCCCVSLVEERQPQRVLAELGESRLQITGTGLVPPQLMFKRGFQMAGRMLDCMRRPRFSQNASSLLEQATLPGVRGWQAGNDGTCWGVLGRCRFEYN